MKRHEQTLSAGIGAAYLLIGGVVVTVWLATRKRSLAKKKKR